jgi:hypothetical protein
MSTEFGYNMTSNKLVMTKVHVFFNDPRSYSFTKRSNSKNENQACLEYNLRTDDTNKKWMHGFIYIL